MTKTINRRAMLKGATTLPMLALPCVAAGAAQSVGTRPMATLTSMEFQDPLYLAIARYQYGMSMFSLIDEADWNKLGGESAVIESTYGAPFDVLADWDQAALNLTGAIEALRLAADECKWFSSSPTVQPMILAALKFFANAKEPQQVSLSQCCELMARWPTAAP